MNLGGSIRGISIESNILPSLITQVDNNMIGSNLKNVFVNFKNF